jgi:hypothetical protein
MDPPAHLSRPALPELSHEITADGQFSSDTLTVSAGTAPGKRNRRSAVMPLLSAGGDSGATRRPEAGRARGAAFVNAGAARVAMVTVT